MPLPPAQVRSPPPMGADQSTPELLQQQNSERALCEQRKARSSVLGSVRKKEELPRMTQNEQSCLGVCAFLLEGEDSMRFERAI